MLGSVVGSSRSRRLLLRREYEQPDRLERAVASIAVTITVDQLFPASFIFVLPPSLVCSS